MSDITYANKDKNAPIGSPEKQWRDIDANEVKTAVNTKVDKVAGKGLSTEDYTTAEKAKVANVPSNTNAELALKANDNVVLKTSGNQTATGVKSFPDGIISHREFVETTGDLLLGLSQVGLFVEISGGAPVQITVPPESSVAWHDGVEIEFVRKTSQEVSFVAGAGVTIRSVESRKRLNKQYSAAVLKYVGNDVWYLIGDLKV